MERDQGPLEDPAPVLALLLASWARLSHTSFEHLTQNNGGVVSVLCTSQGFGEH